MCLVTIVGWESESDCLIFGWHTEANALIVLFLKSLTLETDQAEAKRRWQSAIQCVWLRYVSSSAKFFDICVPKTMWAHCVYYNHTLHWILENATHTKSRHPHQYAVSFGRHFNTHHFSTSIIGACLSFWYSVIPLQFHCSKCHRGLPPPQVLHTHDTQ